MKIFVIGIDQAILPLTRKLVEEGGFPSLKRLLEEGAANQVVPSFPAWTPTNWATIATGADTGTHGVFGWQVAMPTGQQLPSFHSYSVKAETIWEVAERAGLKSATIHFPAAMPPRVKKGIVVDGDGAPGYGESRFEITPSKCYTNLDLPGAEQVELTEARAWKNHSKDSAAALEAELVVIPKFKGKEKRLYLLVTASSEYGFDRVSICRKRDLASLVAEIGVGEWSGWFFETFFIENRKCAGSVRFKLVELSPDASRFRLYRSQIMPVQGFSYPDEIGKELIDEIGPYQEHVSEYSYILGWTGYDTCLEEAEYQAQWFARAAAYLAEQKGVSLFYSHWHFLDDVNHHHLAHIDPCWSGYEPKDAEIHWQVIRKSYGIIDRYMQCILANLSDQDYLILISDHGNLPVSRQLYLEKFLEDKRYLVRRDRSLPLSALDQDWDKNIDWDRTKAYLKGGTRIDFSIYINAEGETKKRVEDKLLRDLRTWVDPYTGKTPIAIALKKRDAFLLGCWGENVGDIVFVLEPEYTVSFLISSSAPQCQEWIFPNSGVTNSAHGTQLPTYQTEVSSHLAMFVIHGPDIKKGYSRDPDQLGYIKMNQIVPTICQLLSIPPPAQSQGAVINDLFVGNETSRQLPSTLVEDRELDDRVTIQLGMHDYSLLQGKNKDEDHYLQRLSRISWSDDPRD
ncbi:MAG: alkaline phosphatase family protein [Spirochaetaceae bacterium]|nr:MAG: alkaline phosphatase family protein [Spirochaetaceae bacterium]